MQIEDNSEERRNEIHVAPVRPETAVSSTYPGSGENRNPTRVLKIEEIVQWDMDFGVTVGPAGYDHRLRCPYCGRRMLLAFHEGGRERSGIRIAYICEGCGAHTLTSFTPPGHKVEIPEVTFGERIVISKPTPVPPDPDATAKPTPERSSKREKQAKGASATTAQPVSSTTTDATTVLPASSRNQQRRNQPSRPSATGQPSTTAKPPQPRRNDARPSSAPIAGEKQLTPPRREVSPGREAAQNAPLAGSPTTARGSDVSSRTTPPTATATRPNEIQDISETLQDRADRAASKAPPYHRRRRRPFRPQGSK